MKKIPAFLVLILATATGLSAASYTVGLGDEFGKLPKPAPGDTIIIRNGVYDSEDIVFKADGTAGAPVVLQAQQPGKVVLTGKTRLRLAGSHIVVSGLWFRDPVQDAGKSIVEMKTTDSALVDCAITGYGTKEDADTDYKWLSVYGERNTIEGCSFEDKKNMGCLLVVWFEKDRTPAHIIRGNYFTRPTILFEDDGHSRINGQEALRIGTSHFSMESGNCIVEDNTFYRCDGEIEVISNKSYHNVYRNNLFLECQGAMTLRHGGNCEVTGNYFIGNSRKGTGGVRVIAENHLIEGNRFENIMGDKYYSAICLIQGVADSPLNRYFQVKDTRVTGNTIVNCRQGIVVSYGASSDQSLPVVSTLIDNNVIVNDDADNLAVWVIDKPHKPEVIWQENIISGGDIEGARRKDVAASGKRPRIEDVSAAWKAIQDNSGVNWELK